MFVKTCTSIDRDVDKVRQKLISISTYRYIVAEMERQRGRVKENREIENRVQKDRKTERQRDKEVDC